jgi:lysozyme
MKTNEAGLNLIRSFEGFRESAYKDAAGHLTIGYGHKVLASEIFPTPISLSEAEQLMEQDVTTTEDAIEELVTVLLNQNQHGALVSWVYNEGVGALKASTLLKVLNEGNYEGVPEQILRWDKITDLSTGEKKACPGLTRRREAECALWNTPVQDDGTNKKKFRVKVYLVSGMIDFCVDAGNEEEALKLAEHDASEFHVSEFLESDRKVIASEASPE